MQINVLFIISVTIFFTFISNMGESVNVNAQSNQSFPNGTDLTNSSNTTRDESIFTNSSQVGNTTIPEQLPPESVNGSETGKI